MVFIHQNCSKIALKNSENLHFSSAAARATQVEMNSLLLFEFSRLKILLHFLTDWGL